MWAGVVAAVLLSHRLFLFPAFGPLIYNMCIILGGVLAAASRDRFAGIWALAGAWRGHFWPA